MVTWLCSFVMIVSYLSFEILVYNNFIYVQYITTLYWTNAFNCLRFLLDIFGLCVRKTLQFCFLICTFNKYNICIRSSIIWLQNNIIADLNTFLQPTVTKWEMLYDNVSYVTARLLLLCNSSLLFLLMNHSSFLRWWCSQ